jgi:hypothetical protein
MCYPILLLGSILKGFIQSLSRPEWGVWYAAATAEQLPTTIVLGWESFGAESKRKLS